MFKNLNIENFIKFFPTQSQRKHPRFLICRRDGWLMIMVVYVHCTVDFHWPAVHKSGDISSSARGRAGELISRGLISDENILKSFFDDFFSMSFQ